MFRQLVLAFCAAFPLFANAALITVYFEGTITSVTGDRPFSQSIVNVGDPFSGAMTYETPHYDFYYNQWGDRPEGNLGSYYNPLWTSTYYTLGSERLEISRRAGHLGNSLIRLHDNYATDNGDGTFDSTDQFVTTLWTYSNDTLPEQVNSSILTMTLTETQSALSLDEYLSYVGPLAGHRLTQPFPSFEQFTDREFSVYFFDSIAGCCSTGVHGNLTRFSLTPASSVSIPASSVLLLAGLCALGIRTRVRYPLGLERLQATPRS